MNDYQKQLWDALNNARKDSLESVLDNVNLFQRVKDNDYIDLLRDLYVVRANLSLNIQNQLEYYWKKEGIDKCSPGWCIYHYRYDVYGDNIKFIMKNDILRCPKCNRIIIKL